MGFGPPQGAAAIQDISAVNFSAGTTSSNVGSIVFSNSNGVSFGLNGLTITGTVATNYDLAANSTNYAGVGKTIGTTTGTDIVVTYNTAGLNLGYPKAITTAMLSGASTQFVQANAGFNGTSCSGTISSNSFSVSVGPYITTGMLSGASTQFVQANATFALTSISATVASNGFSLSVGPYITTAALSANTSNYAGINSAITNGSMTVNTSGISVNVNLQTISSYANMDQFGNTTTMGFNGASVSHAVAFQMPHPGSFSFLRIPVLMTTATGSIAGAASITTAQGFLYSTWNAVIYSLSTGASSKSLASFASGSVGFTFSNNVSGGQNANSTQYSITQAFTVDAVGGVLAAGTSTQYSQSAASATLSSGLFTNFSSLRFIDIRFANSLSAGPYWAVIGYSSSSTTSGQGASAMTACSVAYSNHYGVTQANSWWEVMGGTAGSSGGYLGAGSFSTAGGGTTNAFPISAISSSASNNLMYFQLIRSA